MFGVVGFGVVGVFVGKFVVDSLIDDVDRLIVDKMVGLFVGHFDGETVGLFDVGINDDDSDGFIDGILVGILLGFNVGILLWIVVNV